ncbi:cytochrome P450 [Solwaraspora sp. WMMD406]|uniref:cytochrome P450 n=1 Tax=Solwaraspora sp. WMMD406 TaxID=3016095 RepID=UPI002416CA87|nr:cytochrome P450 [Solwaraspora sp. WMMD406]MDG4765937.1 cytochrome P450 [Solwaraspora sp. WMMD406]
MTDPPPPYPFRDFDELGLDPRLARLRAQCPVSRVRLPYGGDAWLATRYADVTTVLADPRFSRAAACRPDVPRQTEAPPVATTILDLDRPEHSRLRRIAATAFAQWRVELLRPYVRQVAAERVDALLAGPTPADLCTTVALPVPMTVLCHVLGVPLADRDRFRVWTEALLAPGAMPADRFRAIAAQLEDYLGELIAHRRRSATDDLLGVLVRATDDGATMTERELVSFGVTLLAAGFETTASHLASSTYLLLRHRRFWDLLCRSPQRVPDVVRELLRFVPLNGGSGLPRVATEDVELGGVTIRAGEAVFTSAVSANRDATVYPDPDTFDPDRRPAARHLAFGHGPHRCLGAWLSTMELEEVIGTLTARVPGLRLLDPDGVRWRTGTIVRGPLALPVHWSDDTVL